MSVEFYKKVACYRPLIIHEKTGETFDLIAVVLQDDTGKLWLRYSHTYRDKPEKGFYYPDSIISPKSLDEAEKKVREWSENLAQSHEVAPW